MISERERNNNMSQILQLGQNKHNYVWKAYWLCLYKYIYTDLYINTYTDNMEYTYTHTRALNSVSYYYLYHLPFEAVSTFDAGKWWLTQLKWVFLKGSDSKPESNFALDGYYLNQVDPILSTL